MIKDLVYKHIGNGIMNTRIPIKNEVQVSSSKLRREKISPSHLGPQVQVSLSYSLPSSRFSSIGSKEQPQGAIVLIHSNIEDLYSLDSEGENIEQCNTIEDIEYLINIAKEIKPNLLISIFDTCGASPPSWHPSFITERGSQDHLYKLDYLNQIYKEHEILYTDI